MNVKKRLVRANENGNEEQNRKSNLEDERKSAAVSVVFRSLILDLLAFTMILPLLPALLDHYKDVDDGRGLYTFVLKQINGIQTLFNAPDRFSSVIFGGNIIF